MIIRVAAISTALILAGCNRSDPGPDNGLANTIGSANTVAPAKPAADAGGSLSNDNAVRFDKYSRCASSMLEMSKIYKVLARTDTSGKRADLEEQSDKRRKVANTFYDLAVERGAAIGKTKADIETIHDDVESGYERLRENESFTAFAEKVAADADDCQKLAQDTP